MHSAAPAFPRLVPLSAGSQAPPLFIAHGLGANAQELVEIARNLETSHSVYCMQAQGCDGVEEPLDRIEEMARYHLESIKHLQPHGPYLLAGYSLGGLVALEIAQRLASEGEPIALLAMIDSYPHASRISFTQRLRLNLRIAKRRIGKATRPQVSMDTTPQIAAVATPKSMLSAMEPIHASSHLAWKRYQPRFYAGKINFFKAEICTTFPDDPVAIWSGLAKEFECQTVPGDHKGMITTNAAQLASALSNSLKGALA